MKIKIIIADDHPVARLGLQTFLQNDPEIQIVGIALNGLEAVEKTRELKPDVVLMDLSMPVMNGFEATTIIKQETPGVRVLVLTSTLDENSVSKALLAGADEYLIKGNNVDTLLSSIKRENKFYHTT